MKFYCIVVYTSLQAKEHFQTSINTGWFNTEPHLQKIQTNLPLLLKMLNDYDGLHRLKLPDGNYYAYLNGDALALVAGDETLSALQQMMLFDKISLAKNSDDLNKILNEPEAVFTSRIDDIKEELDETVDIMRDNIEKLVLRREDLNQIMNKSEKLTMESLKFSRRATDFKNKTRCPGLFSIFNYVRSAFGADPYVYDYEPVVQTNIIETEPRPPGSAQTSERH